MEEGLIILLIFLFSFQIVHSAVREVSKSSCEVIHINLGLGMTTQVLFEQDPKVTLYADKKHFKISTNTLSPRSLAIIPFIESSEMDAFRNNKGQLPSSKILASHLDVNFRTNLFVFFENNNQLMLDLRFVEKRAADYIVKIKQVFNRNCAL